MLKSLLINQKKVPVPVPVKTLTQALQWVEDTLVPDGHTITRIELDGRILTDGFEDDENLGESIMTSESLLVIQIDSPIELAVQTMEAINNLASVIYSGLKILAVECWQSKPIDKPRELSGIAGDVELILDLVSHSAGLIDPTTIETAAINGIAVMLKRDSKSLQLAISNSDWKASARILLNRVEPLLNDLISETESLQIKVMALNNSAALARAGS